MEWIGCILFAWKSINGQLWCLQCLTITNKAVMNTCLEVLYEHMFPSLSGKYSVVEGVLLMVNVCLTCLKTLPNCFQNSYIVFIQGVWQVLYPHICLCSHSTRCVVVSDCGLNLHFSAGWWFNHHFVGFLIFFFLFWRKIGLVYLILWKTICLIVLILMKFKLTIFFLLGFMVCVCVCV